MADTNANGPMDLEVTEVVLIDESGLEVVFDHLMTFFYEKEKYIALMPVDDGAGLEEGEVLLMHVVEKDGEDVYETIDNQVLLDEVFEEFMALFEEMIEAED